MRHGVQGRSLGRERAHRRAVLKNLATSLILHEAVVTTEDKAKEIRRYIEPLVTRAKVKSLPNRRLLGAAVAEPGAARKLVEDLGPKYKDRAGGYLRLTKVGTRPGDGARRVKVEFV